MCALDLSITKTQFLYAIHGSMHFTCIIVFKECPTLSVSNTCRTSVHVVVKSVRLSPPSGQNDHSHTLTEPKPQPTLFAVHQGRFHHSTAKYQSQVITFTFNPSLFPFSTTSKYRSKISFSNLSRNKQFFIKFLCISSVKETRTEGSRSHPSKIKKAGKDRK